MSKKTAIFKDTTTNAKITLIQNDDNSINLEVDNAKGLMRLISKQTGFQYDDEWNTQTLGSKLIDFINNPSDTITAKKTAVFKDNETNAKITLIQKDDNSIDFEVDNTKGLLRLIAKQVGFQCDADWNTQTLGSKLIDVINNPTETAVEGSLVADKADSTDKFFRWYEVYDSYDAYQAALEKDDSIDEDEMSGLSEGAWNWWIKLPEHLKALILEQCRSVIENEGKPLYIWKDGWGCWADEDGNNPEEELEEGEALWFKDKEDDFIDFLLMDYISELYMISFKVGEDQGHQLTSYKMDKLAYLPNLQHIEFYNTYGYGLPFELMDLPYIKELNYESSDLGSDNWLQLLGFAKTHPQMESLDISDTPMEEYLEEEPEKVAVLRALMPNCDIKSSASLSTEKANAETVEKHLNTEMMLWWNNADDFSRYAYLALFKRNNRSSSLNLPLFDESNGFKIVSSDINLDDYWANNGYLWRVVTQAENRWFEIELNIALDLANVEKIENYSLAYFLSRFKLFYSDVFGRLGFPMYLSKVENITYINAVASLDLQSDITGFDDLESLCLKDCDAFPSGFSSLGKLRELELDKTKQADHITIPENLTGFNSLNSVDLRDGGLKKFPIGLGSLPVLEKLVLADNAISTISENLTGFNSLNFVNLNENGLTEFPVGLGSLPMLKILELKHNAISIIPDDLMGFAALSKLSLAGEEKEGVEKLSVSEAIKLSKLPSLENLTLPKYLEEEEENIKKHFSEDVHISFSSW